MPKKAKPGKVRIIGGAWRSRSIPIPDTESLRPTIDSIRETLFNWLAPVISQAHCLDLFAGTGALGFEALSRGAEQVVFVDQSTPIIQHLQTIAKQFAVEDKVTILQGNATHPIALNEGPFDIVFLDPPFHQNLLEPTCEWLEESNLLSDNCYLYLEAERQLSSLPTPNNWHVVREKIAGQVAYCLLWREHEPR